jgi:tRNA(adenine34) deaminase
LGKIAIYKWAFEGMVMDYDYYMTKALQQAAVALAAGEFPVGCVMVCEDRIIATGARKNTTGNSTNEVDHAEMIALRRLYDLETKINFKKVVLFSTLEPCLMCFGALLISDIRKIVFAYEDAMGGGTHCDLSKLPPLYKENQISIIPHILRKESLHLLKTFFSNPENTYLNDSHLATYTLRQ